MIRERALSTISGWLAIPIWIAGLGLTLWQFVGAVNAQEEGVGNPLYIVAWLLAMVLLILLLKGFFVVNPNEEDLLTLFGSYAG